MDLRSIFNIFQPFPLELDDIAFIYSPYYNLSLEEHVFPAHKFRHLYELIHFDEILSKSEFYEPEKAKEEDLLLVHSKELLEDLSNLHSSHRTKYSELPLLKSIVESFLYAVGGTIQAMELTQKHRFVYNIGGGFHHSYPDHAEGFCYLNDVAVAAKVFLRQNPKKKVLLIDLDLHQGNGNSFIFKDNPSVFTFSMHQESIYPVKETSNYDVPLHDYCSDKDYLDLLSNALSKIKSQFHPDLVFYLAGADPYKDDLLGNLKLTKNGLINRDTQVKNYIHQTNARCVVVTAGGYAKDFNDTVNIHYNTARVFGTKR